MAVKLTKSQVSKTLSETKGVYEDTCSNLKKAYDKMNNLYTYWGGNLYNIIQKNWNGQVVELNNFMKATANAYNLISHALLQYTTAENKPDNRGTVTEIALGGISSSNEDKLTATSETIRADKLDIVGSLNTAKNDINTIFNNLTNIDASSPAIDEAKNTIKRLGNTIMNNLESIKNDINNNMETAASNYEAAERSIQ